MIKAISDKRIDWLVNQIVKDDNLMRIKPVLAGGSMLSVYRAYRLYDSEAKWKQLERASQFTDLKVSPKNHLFSDKIEPFGDIDAWFLSDNSVHKGGFGSWMVSAVEYGQELQEPLDLSYRLTKTSKWANSFRREEKSHSFIFQIIKNKTLHDLSNFFITFPIYAN